ncbi:ABC transporter permease [Pseudothermotoga sp.]|uniref:ABC transporter permease n=1 Tax=Pseudothermotoga sp. TaxID=2033661 RepID=UPI002995F7D0|nr:ABC transporter permease [Pseudothermotoga sp.]MCX7813467.1 ABC transporter permease [Pseudothermotoga sp.]MDW8139545.1 ABC transporter permease [Pseudothermotoga sp.]
MKAKIAWLEFLRFALSILIALFIGYVFLLFGTKNPSEAFKWFLYGPISTQRRFVEFLNNAVPLMFTGLSLCLVFQAKIFNIGAEGQFFFGAFGAMLIALTFPAISWIHLLLTLLGAALFGAAWAFVPAWLKTRWKASELVSSLMMNYISYLLVLFLVNNYFRDKAAGALVSYRFPQTAWLATLTRFRLNSGLFVAVGVVIVIGLLVYRTKFGYEIRAMGANKKFAFYSGINVSHVMFWVQILAGAIAGLAGGIEISAMYRRFVWQSFPGYGFDGIVVAIIARNNPFLVIPSAFFIAYLRVGANIMGRLTGIAPEVVIVLQSIMILLITAEALLAKFKQRIIEREAMKE